MKSLPVQKSDKVSDSKPVKVDNTKDVNTPYSDKQVLKLDEKSQSLRYADASSSFSWDKVKDTVDKVTEMPETAAKNPKTFATVVASVVVLVTALGGYIFKKRH